MISSTDKATKKPFVVNKSLVFAVSFLAVTAITMRLTDLIGFQPMNMFLAAITCMMAASISALWVSFRKQSANPNITNIGRIVVSGASAFGTFYFLNWLALLGNEYIAHKILSYQIAVGMVLLVKSFLDMYSDNTYFFNEDLWRATDQLLPCIVVLSVILGALPMSLTNSNYFSYVLLFATCPLMLLGILSCRNQHQYIGITLMGPFTLAVIDWLLVTSGVMSFQEDLMVQIGFMVVITVVRWAFFRILPEM